MAVDRAEGEPHTPPTEAELLSIQVGRPRTYTDPPRFANRPAPWSSGFEKRPVSGPVWLGEVNLDGDAQADLNAHGGADKAVNVYPQEHYRRWREEGLLTDLPPGAFGENFHIRGLTEANVCIGDVFAVGDARVQVSQPRQPCWKLAHFLGVKDMVRRVVQAGRTGWYFRVLVPGRVCAGDRLVLQERPHPEWTLAEANHVMHHARDPRREADLLDCPALSASWQRTLGRRLASR